MAATLFSKTVWKMHGKSTLLGLKKSFGILSEIKKTNDVFAIEEIRKEIEAMKAQMVKDEMLGVEIEQKRKEALKKLEEHQPTVDAQMEIIKKEQEKLDEILKVHEGIEGEVDSFDKELKRLKDVQSKMYNESKRMTDELNAIIKKKNESAGADTIDEEIDKLSEKIRKKILKIATEYGPIPGHLDIQEDAIQYRFEWIKRNGLVEGVYFVTVSPNISTKDVILYKVEDINEMPSVIAKGVESFDEVEEGFESEVKEVGKLSYEKLKNYLLALEENK